MAVRLSDYLVRDGTLTMDVVRLATARQAVYGGALDTALLELGAVDEPTLWGKLAVATGAPIPDAGLFESPDPTAATVFDVAWSRRCRAVPVGQRDGVVQICCSEPFEETQLAAARAALGLQFEVYVVPEVRLAAARQAVYGEPMPPRLLRVLARLLGAQPVRKWVKALTPEKKPVAAAPVDAAPAQAAAPGLLDDADLAEAEFDVPINTQNADIISSRPSRAALEAVAADEVARALDLGGAPAVLVAATAEAIVPMAAERGLAAVPAATAAAAAPVPAGALVPLAHAAEGPGALVVAPAPASDTSPGRAIFHTPGPLPTLEDLADDKEDALCRVADDAESEERLAALRSLRGRFDRPRVRELADKLQEDLKGPAERAVLAASALGELRNAQAVPALIEAMKGPPSVAQTAARALVEIAKQDFGQSRKKWLAWWEAHQTSDRTTWLLEGLSHKAAEIRFSSSEELRLITGEYFGYHYDLPKREREEARERWQSWWYQSGHARLPDRR